MPNDAAKRSKPRRLSTKAFADASAGSRDGMPTSPRPVPDELTWAFTEAVWRNLPWTGTTWLGRAVATAPADLLPYQEMIVRVRPDWVIETGTDGGGRALFLASICDLVGHGTVILIDEDDHETPEHLPQHPRLRYLTGEPGAPATVETVRGIVGDRATAVVVLGARADRVGTHAQFEVYSPFVPVGSYVVVADTIVNGHPVWTSFGPGPAEAVKQILNGHGEFVADPTMEKYSLTFNPGGFVLRVR